MKATEDGGGVKEGGLSSVMKRMLLTIMGMAVTLCAGREAAGGMGTGGGVAAMVKERSGSGGV